MVNFIANRIEKEANKSIEDGIAKYAAYFINTNLYEKYRESVDNKLREDGYEGVIPVEEIVTE